MSIIKKYKFYILILGMIGIGIFFFILRDNPLNIPKILPNGVKEFGKNAPDIILFNQVLQTATKRDDYKKCNDIENEDVKQNCIAQIKLRFSDIGLANTINDCEKITGDDALGTQKKRKDVCYLNLSKNTSLSYEASQEICNHIQNEDLKGLCFAQGKLKFGKSN